MVYIYCAAGKYLQIIYCQKLQSISTSGFKLSLLCLDSDYNIYIYIYIYILSPTINMDKISTDTRYMNTSMLYYIK